MSPAERLARRRFIARTAKLEPVLRDALLETWDEIAAALKPGELEALIRAGTLDALISDDFLDRELVKYQAVYQATMREAAVLMAKDIPGLAAAGVFNVLNPRVIDAVQKLDTKVVRGLKEEIRGTVRDYVEAGLREGIGPRTLARGLRETIGMAPNQAQAVRNFRTYLEEGKFKTALDRKLRDKRFDRTLQKLAGTDGRLPKAQVDKMVDAYRRRMIAFNAETHARSAAIDALKKGQDLSWADAVEKGYVDGTRLRKRWVTVGDSRVRPEHAAMNGEEAAWDEAYPNGDSTPGENDYNCRCRSQYFQERRPQGA